jgi:hypothetical protein
MTVADPLRKITSKSCCSYFAKEDDVSTNGLVLAFSLALSASAWAEDPREIPAPIDRVFIPNGYDSNDNVEVILHGEFRNSCYRVGHAGAKLDLENHRITVFATAYEYPDAGDCAQVITPFIQTVKLGVIPQGMYRVVYQNNPSVGDRLIVKETSTAAADDHFYAPVEFADIERNANGEPHLILYGSYPRMLIGCALFSEIRVMKDSSDLLVVMPILRTTEGEECQNVPARFKRSIKLDRFVEGDGLLHVRVLSGNSFNRFFRAGELK